MDVLWKQKTANLLRFYNFKTNKTKIKHEEQFLS